MTGIERIRLAYEDRVRFTLRDETPVRRQKVLDALETYGSIDRIPRSVWSDIGFDVERRIRLHSQRMVSDAYRDAVTSAKRQDGFPVTEAMIALLILWWLLSDDDPDNKSGRASSVPAGLPAPGRVMPELPIVPREPVDMQRLEDVADDRTSEIGEQLARAIGQDVAEATKRRLEKAEEQGEVGVDAVVDPDALDSIVVTRTTSGAAGARRLCAADVGPALGMRPVEIWIAERDSKTGELDERVCPICRPLDQQPAEVWLDRFPLGPAAHPNCRCDTAIILMPRETGA